MQKERKNSCNFICLSLVRIFIFHIGKQSWSEEIIADIICFTQIFNLNYFIFLVFDFHQAADGIQEQQRQEQAGKK